MNPPELCNDCGGRGYAPEVFPEDPDQTPDVWCHTCGGTGYVDGDEFDE